MDDVAPVEDVIENEACGASTKGAGHGEHCPLGWLKPPWMSHNSQYDSVKTTSPCSLDPQGAGAVHGEVAPPGDEQPGAAEGWVTHHNGLRRSFDS